MRHIVAGLGLVVAVTGCSSPTRDDVLSANAARWQPGSAVVVLSVELQPKGDAPLDISRLGRRPGVLSVSGDERTLKIALSRQAALVDLAALTLELERHPGVTHVRQVVVPPSR